MERQPFDLETVDHLLRTTRAVRRRLDLDRPVPTSVLLECIDLAQYAPSAQNTQRWRWVIVDDAETRQQVADVYSRGMGTLRKLAAAASGRDRRMYDAVIWLAEHLERMPALVFPCLLDRPSNEFASWDHGTRYASVLPAVWSFQLALRSRGLGSTLTTMHLRWEEEVGDILDIPKNVLQVAMLPVAYTVGNEFKRPKRGDPEAIVARNRWRDDWATQ